MSESRSYLPVYSPRITPLRNDFEELVAVRLLENINGHDDSNDGFTPIPHGSYDFQRLDCIAVHGKNATAEELRSLAQLIYPQAEQIIDMFASRKDLLNHAASLLLRGEQFAMMTDHFKSVIGVAVGGGTFLCALYENTPVTPESIDTNLFASYFIKYTKLQGVIPTPIVLADIFTQTTFTLPPSPSVRGAIPSNIRQEVNRESMVQYFEHKYSNEQTATKGRFTMFAGSGGRDVTIPRLRSVTHTSRLVPKTTHMGPLAFGTFEITRAMPTIGVGVDISGQKPRVYIGELPPAPFDKSFEADAVMNAIAKNMSHAGHYRIYHPSRDDFYAAIGRTDN